MENEARVAGTASPHFAPYVQEIAVAQALLPVRLAFVPYVQGIAVAQALLPVRLAFVPYVQGIAPDLQNSAQRRWRSLARHSSLTGQTASATNAQTDAGNAGQIVRRRGGLIVVAFGEKEVLGASPETKDVI